MIKLGTNYLRPKEMSSLIKTKFEDIESYIPVGYHGYLKRRYKNYMQLPPKHRQQGHHGNDNYMQDFSAEQSKEVDDFYMPDPFNPCEHKEILHWKDRKNTSLQSNTN